MSEWIPVKDRLPETSINCLVSNIDSGMRDLKAIFMKYNVNDEDRSYFQLYAPSLNESITVKPTHWMEIPLMPKE